MKWVFAALVAAAAALAIAPAAFATPPANDTFAGAEVISLPFSATIDTTEATTDSDDAEANALCGFQATEASVWYSYTEPEDAGRLVDVSGSDYSVGVIVVTGSPGSFSFVACGGSWGPFAFLTTAGQTYSILVFDYSPGGTNGGTLQIDVADAGPPPAAHLTIDPVGQVNSHTGVATITGTFTCSGRDTFAFLDAYLRQHVGRFTVYGYTFMQPGQLGDCDGEVHPWSADIPANAGTRFAGGKANAQVYLTACGLFPTCVTDLGIQDVTLRGH